MKRFVVGALIASIGMLNVILIAEHVIGDISIHDATWWQFEIIGFALAVMFSGIAIAQSGANQQSVSE